MRALLIASFVILPLMLFYALRAVTGDPLSAVIFGLILIVSVVSWFAGLPVRTGGANRW